MSEKIVRLGIHREDDSFYYLRDGDVYALQRTVPELPPPEPKKVAELGLELDDARYLYFVDSEGDVARVERAASAEPTSPRLVDDTQTRFELPAHLLERIDDHIARQPIALLATRRQIVLQLIEDALARAERHARA